jgi:hypothetical protein
LGDTILRTYGRTNPARTVAEVCIPVDPENKSIIRPVAKDKRRSNHDGISIGKRRINII